MRQALGSANLVEIFSSIQGEGPHVGETTLFVRFGGCDLRCRWCDSPHTWRPAATCRVETARGTGSFTTRDNPVPIAAALDAAEALGAGLHRFASLTGGEPLLQPEAVRALAAGLRGAGTAVYLETHGLAVEALEQVIDAVDVVSMDWKLASDVRRESDPRRGLVADFHARHEAFLRIARSAPEVFVKVVVTRSTRDAELDAMADAVAKVDAATPIVVQPVTPHGPVRDAPDAARLLSIVTRLSERLAAVRLIPQTHKLYGVL